MTAGTGTASFVPNANDPNAAATVSEYGTKEFTWTEINGTCVDSAAITVNFYEQPVANAGAEAMNVTLISSFRQPRVSEPEPGP